MSSGGGSSQPTSSTVTQTTIPEYARPYVEKALGQASALTDINQNPYQVYGGERFAQFTPMQQQAYQGASQMTTAPQLGAATGMAGAAGLSALGTSYSPYATGQFTGSTAQQYMNPYMQNVVDVQQQAAQRQADIASQAQKAQFAQAGAFGGGRSAIAGAQAAADLARQKQGIQAQGLQQAYGQAQQQFNQEQQLREQSRQYGAGLQMQGLQTGLQAAGQLGQLGQQQFQQGMDINKLQAGYGTQQQQQVQNILNAQYQDFLNAKQYPYQQLSFMSDILRGGPLSQTYSQSYQQPPSMLGQLAGLGMGAYAMTRKEGGPVQSYAYGGNVTSEQFVEGAIHRLSSQQLQQALQNALNRRDTKRAQAIQEEMQDRAEAASFSRGLAGALPNMDNMLPTEESMARGGIVAFSQGGDKGEKKDEDTGFGGLAYLLGLAPAAAEVGKAVATKVPTGALSGAGTAATRTAGSGLASYLGLAGETAAPAGAVLTGGAALSSAATRKLKENPILQEDLGEVGGGLNPDWALAAAIQREGAKEDAKKEAYEKSIGGGRGSPEAYSKYDPQAAAEAYKNMQQRVTGGAEQGKQKSNAAGNAALVGNAMASTLGVSPSSVMDQAKSMFNWLQENDKAAYAAVQKQIDEIKDQAKEIGAGKFKAALAEFGFNMAAAASQPGTGKGVAGALRAAGAASPTLMRSVKETEELQRKYTQLGKQMEVSLMQSRVAAEKGDKQAAIQFARMSENADLARQQLAEQIRHNRSVEGISAGRVASAEDKRRVDLARAGLMARRMGEDRARNEFKDVMNAAELKKQGVTYEQLAKRYSDEEYQKLLMSMTSLQPAE